MRDEEKVATPAPEEDDVVMIEDLWWRTRVQLSL